MIWEERKNRVDKSFDYHCEDYFGDLAIKSNQRLSPDILDLLQMSITKGDSGENKFVIKRKSGIIEVYYKFNKNKKPLWEKIKPEEL